jgi:SNF2 family DNA or RNA helicase
VGYKNQTLLSSLIAPFTARVLKKDCLDLPEKIYQTRYVELTVEQKRIYKDLVKQCLAQVGEGMVTVTTALTAMLRLHQVTLGYVETSDGTMRYIEHNRIAALAGLLEENPSSAIIFVRFLEDIHQIASLFQDQGKTWVTYSGEDSIEQRDHAVQVFQAGAVPYFIATRAAAKGLTLTAAEQVIYYSQGFSLEDRLQSEDRAHRIGQKKNVLYTDLVAQGTIDDKVILALKNKKELADQVLDRAALEQILTLDE